MATRALLLSGDGKAVEAVTQILEELGFLFEHSSEASFGIARLANRRFDPILVDCDKEDNATLVFNYLQGSALNKTSIVVAIVDGKAGVPTAFRLGANLVIAKPVSLEQAKSTLRTALAMSRKEAQAGKAQLASPAAASAASVVSGAAVQSPAAGDERVQSARAACSPSPSPELAQSDAVPSSAAKPQAAGSSARPNSGSTAPVTVPGATGGMRSAIATPASRGAASPREDVAANSGPLPARLSNAQVEDDDSILAELQELETANAALPARACGISEKQHTNKAPFLVSVIALLVAAFCCAAWLTQPNFRNLVSNACQRLPFRTAGFWTKRRTAPAPPAQAPSQAAQSAAQSTAPVAQTVQAADIKTPGSDSIADQASASTAKIDAGASSPAASLQNINPNNPDNSIAAVPVLAPAASTTGKPSSNTSSEPIVLPEDIADGNVVHRVHPVYPKRAQQKRLHGAVVLQVVINQRGKVDSVQVIDGNPVLAAAAKDAVKQWRYKPYFHSGEAVAFETQVTVHFRLP